MHATVGYAVADDIVVTAMTGFGGALDSLNLLEASTSWGLLRWIAPMIQSISTLV